MLMGGVTAMSLTRMTVMLMGKVMHQMGRVTVMMMTRMTVMLMGRVRNQMSAELLELRPGAGQIEPSATGGALQPIWNQSLNIHWYCNLLQQHTQTKYTGNVAAVADAILQPGKRHASCVYNLHWCTCVAT